MVGRVAAVALDGVEGRPVEVQVHIGNGLPGLHLVGLPDAAVRESHDRVKAGISSSDLPWPPRRVVVNLSPGDLVKEGPGFDLPIALGILAAIEELPPGALEGLTAVGEVGLDGRLRPVRGALAVAMTARSLGAAGLLCPDANAAEAALVEGLAIHPAGSLAELCAALKSTGPPPYLGRPAVSPSRRPAEDLADVRGQHLGRRVLEVAAAGGHHLLLVGPPGAGKSMLARRLPGILPPLADAEALEVTRIHSVAGLLDEGTLVRHRPFRAPHHTISAAALVGGGSRPIRPGEVSLAHHGVLFMDELAAFPRFALDALREPLDEGRVRISRVRRACSFPARFQLVAATNPCPCGFRDDPTVPCRCGDLELATYDRKLSGPLLDRIDLLARLERPDPDLLLSDDEAAPSEVVAARVAVVREAQAALLRPLGADTYGSLTAAQLRRVFRPTSAARRALAQAARAIPLSGRGIDKVRRVSLTLAGLGGREGVEDDDVFEALSLRGGPMVGSVGHE